MGSAPTGFDVLAQAAPAAARQQQQIQQEQRVQQQNTVGAQLLDSINNASNIKPTTKDPDTGAEIPNPAYAQAQKDKQNLITQYMGLNSPQQHADFSQRIHGLIFGNPTPQHQQPALSPNSSPVAPPAPPSGAPQGQAASTPAAPAHPFSTTPNPILSKMHEGISALGNHLKAFANPLPPQTQIDPAAIARNYRDPGEVAAERNQALWGTREAGNLAVAQEKTKALVASLAGRRPTLLDEKTIPSLLEYLKIDPETQVYGPNGNPLTPSQLAELPPNSVAREWKAPGGQTFYAIGDQKSKTQNVMGQIFDVPALGPITLGGPNANSTALGQATSTLPHTSSNVSTDAFGTKTTSNTTRQTQVPPVTAAPPNGPAPAGTTPTLLRRPDGLANPVPTVQPVNPGARAPGTQPAGGAVKAKPVSSAAPSVPSSQPLDADGHIPPGAGNDLVRQYANNLLDGQDSAKIPNPRARAAAEQMASQYGWSQGAFTPREKIQFQTATTFLHQLKGENPDGTPLPGANPLNVLDSFVSREKIARAMKDPKSMGLLDRIAAYNLTPPEAEFLRLYNAALGTVQGLSSITRAGRATEASVGRLKTELPNVLQSPSSTDAKLRIDQLLKEANTALQTNPMNVGKKGPVSAKAPSSPGSAPPRPAGVPSDAVWNQQANNGKGQWEK